MSKTKKQETVLLTIIISVMTVLLQLPQLQSIRRVNYIMWPLLAMYIIANQKYKIVKTRFGYIFINICVYILVFCLICGAILHTHLDSYYLRVIFIPLCMYWLGMQLYMWFDRESLQKFFWAYICAVVFFAIILHYTYIPSLSVWRNTEIYLYTSKNSAAQIISMGILLCLFGIKRTNNIKNFIRIVIALYLFFVIGLLQCRAAVLANVLVLFIWAFVKTKNKVIAIITLTVATVVIYNIPFINAFIRQVFLLDTYAGTDLNTFSSNRIVLYREAIEIFLKNPIVGSGCWYIDNLYIGVLAELGVMGGIVLIFFWLFRVKMNVFDCKKSEYHSLLFVMTVYYLITSLLEALPPFGPGSCTFFFWILVGYIDYEVFEKQRLSLEVCNNLKLSC